MCGIAGWVRPGAAPVDERLLVQMRDTLAHRGPDGAGIHIEPGCGLAHRRLALLDISGGAQPMSTADQNLWIVANNEIYNFPELRARLEDRGVRFRTASDTEVLLQHYGETGAAGLDALVGMYACAIWDRRTRSLLLVRDPFGIKPLYYVAGADGDLYFASEMRALLVHPGLARDLDLVAVHDYVRDLAVPEPRTIYRSVRKLPAGHYLIWREGHFIVRRYWDLPARDGSGHACDADELEARLIETTTLSLRSDEPVGLFLSGGLDSGMLAWAATRAGRPLQTFSVAFDEPMFDERQFSRSVARAVGSSHHEMQVSRSDAAEAAAQIAAQLDEPFADSSAIPTFLLARAARAHVKAVLAGEGADELFAGSAWHERSTARVAGAAELAPPGKITFPAPMLNALMTPEARRQIADEENDEGAVLLHQMPSGVDGLHAQLYVDLRTYLPSDLLTKMDRMAMLHSLEVRVPYLNHPFATYVWQTSTAAKYDDGVRKVALRQLGARRLPAEIAQRPKQGFAIPLDVWLWQPGRFRDLVYDTLSGSPRGVLSGLFEWSVVRTMLAEHERLQAVHGHRLWALYMLMQWAARA